MMRNINLIVVHCSATNPLIDWGARDIEVLHQRNGWSTIGYHWVIRRNGIVETGRHETIPGAHVKGHNLNSIGVCLVGGVNFNNRPTPNYTTDQWASLKSLLISLKLKFPNASIVGHRDLSPDLDGDGIIEANEWIKACPCFNVAEWCRLHGIKPERGA